MPPDETSPTQILEENKTENLVGQTTPVPENIPPSEPVLPEEIKVSEPTPTQEISQPEITLPNLLLQQEGVPEQNFTEASPEKSGLTIERHGTDVTITEIMPVPTPDVSRLNLDTKNFLKSLLPKLKEKLFFRTEKRLAKILELARKKSVKGESIQNDDIEKLLHVSDSTATRYLKKLSERGQLKNTGNPKWPKYSPN